MKMLVMVLTDLAASCKKLDETSELPEELPVQVCEFVAKFFTFVNRWRSPVAQHVQGRESNSAISAESIRS
jgi:hypothetical protein